ncbi:MAG: hypothetical protein ACKVOQ_06675 [Cyclobacteriaceae bacterium]
MNNSGLAIRHKLDDFIRMADDKKLSATFHLLGNGIEQTQECWKDKSFTHELDLRYKALENGMDKGFTITKLRKKKYG